jgi:hypothetical protein
MEVVVAKRRVGAVEDRSPEQYRLIAAGANAAEEIADHVGRRRSGRSRCAQRAV